MRAITRIWASAVAAAAAAAAAVASFTSTGAQSQPRGTLREDDVVIVPPFEANLVEVASEADPAVSGRSILDAIHDTEAFVTANDDMIVVVFRGTQELTDWTTNLNMGLRSARNEWKIDLEGCDLHRGFDDGVDTVWLPSSKNGMYQTIKNLYNEHGKSRKLYIAGHSLGGALATIAAARLSFVDDMNIAGIYTIGSPRGAISTSNVWDRLLGRMSALFRGELIDGINDHGTSEYARLFKQAVIASRLSLLDKTKSVVKDAVQKVIPVNMERKKAQLQEIRQAKEAAFKASKVTISPSFDVTDDSSSSMEL
ncbi:lipase [Ectocarpus siliculosus]|uniref:Lipase n=1 Tax=Ectocarpus siliculosus TaxID=2880 RepID=D8LDL1_ECTSI|nr:lipase [Ectocarpus siliculosus]|eukprot:CBN74085.1 lipase [Ectocarpus siliculosus]